ncbi:hypothetical protein LDENG_00035810 [Lucifuga dentata]|nr:hypothetical protein LDENG_00035810 [Lucifuga dentata]
MEVCKLRQADQVIQIRSLKEINKVQEQRVHPASDPFIASSNQPEACVAASCGRIQHPRGKAASSAWSRSSLLPGKL